MHSDAECRAGPGVSPWAQGCQGECHGRERGGGEAGPPGELPGRQPYGPSGSPAGSSATGHGPSPTHQSPTWSHCRTRGYDGGRRRASPSVPRPGSSVTWSLSRRPLPAGRVLPGCTPVRAVPDGQ
nr:hypothetical protein C5F59_38675 [Streptomyces sp. QL37]